MSKLEKVKKALHDLRWRNNFADVREVNDLIEQAIKDLDEVEEELGVR